MLTLGNLCLLLGAVGIGLWFWHAHGIREQALRLAEQECRRRKVILLDGAVAFSRFRWMADAKGRKRLARNGRRRTQWWLRLPSIRPSPSMARWSIWISGGSASVPIPAGAKSRSRIRRFFQTLSFLGLDDQRVLVRSGFSLPFM